MQVIFIFKKNDVSRFTFFKIFSNLEYFICDEYVINKLIIRLFNPFIWQPILS